MRAANVYSGIMEPIAAALSSAEARGELARYYAGLPGPAAAMSPDRATARANERGKKIAEDGVPNNECLLALHATDRAPCAATRFIPRSPVSMPTISYCNYNFLKRSSAASSDYAHIMRRVAAGLSVAQMRDVARYYASLTPGTLQGVPGRENAVISTMRDMISTSLDHAHFAVALHAGELDSLDVFNALLAQLRQQFLLSEKLFAQIVG